MDLSILNNDISFNILSRLPANVLVRLKTVAKGWKHFIENPAFTQLQMKMAEPISISGYFFQEKYPYSNVDFEMLSYITVGEKEPRIYQNVLEFLPEKVTILGSSNGLVCCRSCIPSSDPMIYICNPVNKQWLNVIWDRVNMQDYIAFSFEPSSSSTLNPSISFKLVRVQEVDVFTPGKEECYLTFEIYNWERRMWVKSMEICHCEYSLCARKQVFLKGILYWLTDGCKLVMFDTKNEFSLLISLPIPSTRGNFPNICLGETNGELHCVMVSQEALLVWALEDCFSSKWELKSFISFEVMEQENQAYFCNLAKRVSESVGELDAWMQTLAFKDGILFVRVATSAYSIDTQTRKTRFLCDMSELGRKFMIGTTVIPYALSLTPVTDL